MQIDDVAVLVAEQLDLDVARIDDEFLDEHAVVAERRFGFRLRAGKTFGDFGFGPGDAHALAAAAGGGLDHHRIADLVGDLHRLLVVGDDAEMAGHGRDLGGRGGLLGFDLVAHGGNGLGVRTDKDDAGGFQRLREGLALGQEAVARVDGLGAALLAGGDDFLDHQITLGCGRRANQDGGIGHLDMQRVLVGLRIDGDRLNSHFSRGLDDPAGNFAAIGNQDALEHGR